MISKEINKDSSLSHIDISNSVRISTFHKYSSESSNSHENATFLDNPGSVEQSEKKYLEYRIFQSN